MGHSQHATAILPATDTTRTPAPAAAPPDNVRVLSPRRRELKLARAVAAGEAGAFDRLHAEYRERVYAFAVKRMRDAAEAEDVCQDVFVELLRCIGSFEGRSSLLTWIFGVTHHQICRRLRRRRLESFSLDADEAGDVPAADAPIDRRVDAARVLDGCRQALEEDVSAGQQEIFRLFYGDGRSTRDIARALGKSNQAVKISLFRTRRTLAAAIERRGLEMPA
jgi:RNA polymerase sigma-70 factor (ECF subfamily)